jgi:hypothetical protein
MTSSHPDGRHIGRRLRGVALAAPLALLCACSSDQNSQWGTVYTMFSQSFGLGASGVTREQAAAIPFATLGVSVDNGPEGILVLGTSASGTQLWTAASHIVLLMQNGRILRTAGLGHDRTDMRLIKGDNGPPPLQGSSETVWSEDFGDLHLFSVTVDCRTTARGPETIVVLGSHIATIRVDEDCRSEQLDWSFTNTYWIAPQTGLVWRSVQYVSPKLGPLDTEILRAPS